MRNHGKKFLAILLTLCMLLSVLPMSIFAAENTAEVTGQQLMLGDDLTMHFYVKTEAANATATIHVDGTERASYSLAQMTAGENGYDLFVDLAAAEMTAQIKLTVNDGTSDILTKTYSVQEYAHYLLENNYTDETKALVKEMLNYGAKAQVYFDHNTGNFANVGYEIETESVIPDEAPQVVVSDSLSDVNFYGASMVFESKIAVRFYFTAVSGVEGYSFTVDGKPYTPVSKNGQYYIEVADINPDQMDATLAVSVTKDDGSLSFSYSPMYYITRMYNKDSSSQELKDMLKAANGYFQAAKVFTGVAENRTGSLSFQYRWGNNNTLQVNTNLPSDTPCVSFTASDNGCNIDQTGNTVQWFGWAGMDNVDGTIVLTFHYNNAFTEGQSYVLPVGALFGFTDNSKYILDADYTFTFDGSAWSMTAVTPEPEPEPTEPQEGSLNFAYRYGTNNLIQVNTNLPSNTPCVNFTASDNGCSIDESGNTVQWVGWIGMDNLDGTIVLTFHFNNAFEVEQTYFLPAGAVFGFTDGNTYTLDADYTFTWDGSNWTLTTQVPEPEPEQTAVSFAYRYGTDKLIQFNTNLPAATALKDFLATDNGCQITQNGDQQVGYVSMLNDNGTIVLTFNFNAAFTPGQSYSLAKESVFSFTDGTSYVLDQDYTLYWDGASWTDTEPVPEVKNISLTYRWGNNNTIQYNTDLPATTPCASFTAADNGCNLQQNANQYQQVGWIGMDNVDGTIVLTFHFNGTFEAGQSYIIPAGSIFGFTDGSSYTLPDDVILYWDGAAWDTTESITLTYRYGTNNLIQYNTNLPSDTPCANFTADQNGCSLSQSANTVQQVGWIGMDNVDGTIVLTFHFNSAYTYGQSYILSAGSVFGFTDGSSYKLYQDTKLYWDDSQWTTEEPAPQVDVLDESNFTGGKEFTTFADLPVDSNSVEKIEEYKGLGFNTSLLAEDHTGAKGPDELFTASLTTANAPENSLNFQYRWGAGNVFQVNTNLPASTPLKDFLATDNGCSIDQSANQYKNVGYISMANADGVIVLTFNFGSDFEAGQNYVLPKGAVFGFTDGNTYTLDADYTFTWDGTTWTMDSSALNLSVNAASGKYIQLKTNIPTGLSYGDFLLGDSSKGHNVILETTEGAQAVAWFSYSELSGAVYLTFNFNGYNKAGTQYILKAGTSLKAGDNTYVTDRDYILTVENAYLTSLQNLDNAGLNVWIRNYHNTPDYFTADLTAALLLYKDIIDGFYMTDEPFQTNAMLQASGQANITDFESMVTFRDWFNTNFADKYFHINHVPITSYDHYTGVGGEALNAVNAEGYKKFLQIYKEQFNDLLTNASGASISFDNYPFIHDQGEYGGFFGFGATFESGIQSTYLLNCLIAAQVAAEDDFGLCVQTFEATDLTYKVTRDITSAAEVSLQLYTGMAMGADVFEYFAYNSNGDFDAIMNQDGSKRIYDIVKEGNGALSMHDVINTFTWNGIVTSEGSANSHNKEAFTNVANMALTNISNGVLSRYSSTDDTIIGCFTKGDLNGYMVVNFNDPKAVSGNNTVSLSFENCTRARIYTVVDGVLTSQLVDLTNGSCEVVLAPGSGCFVIPA